MPARGWTASTPSSDGSPPEWTWSTPSPCWRPTRRTGPATRSRSSEWSWLRSSERRRRAQRGPPEEPETGLERGADRQCEDDRADADRPAEDEPDAERKQLDARPYAAEPPVHARSEDDHKRITWPGTHPRSEIQSRGDPVDGHRDREQRDPDPERIVGESVHRADRRQRLDECPDEQGVRDRRETDRRAEPPRDRHHEDADDDVRRPEGQRRVLGDALVEHVPGRQPEPRLQLHHDREREEEESDEQRRPAGDEPAANPRRNVHGALR